MISRSSLTGWKDAQQHSTSLRLTATGGRSSAAVQDPDALAADFWRPLFTKWTHSRLIVSELIRFSLFEADLLPYPFGRERVFDNVVRSLDIGEDALRWLDFEHAKFAKTSTEHTQNGVTIEVDSDGSRLNDFLRIYAETMERRHADLFYSFPRAYFEALHADMPGQFCYFHASHQGRVVSAELVLVSQSRVYSFLGGTESASFYLRPNDLLKYEIILWAKRNGKTAFVLGGGYQRDDGIFRYKKSFAPCGTKAFFLGKRVLDESTYARLVENRHSKARKVGADLGSPVQASFLPVGVDPFWAVTFSLSLLDTRAYDEAHLALDSSYGRCRGSLRR